LTRTAANDAVYKYTQSANGNILTTTLVNDAGTGHSNNTNVYTFINAVIYNGNGIGTTANLMSQSVINQGPSAPLVTKVFCYNGQTPPSACVNSTTVVMPLTQEDVYTTWAGLSTSSHVSQTFDAYMNVTKSAVYDFGATAPTMETVAGPYGYTWNGSTSSPNCSVAIGSGVNNKPCQIQVQNGSGAQLRNTYFAYDAKGNVLSKATLVGGSTYLTTSATYNPNGTVATSTDANLNKTTLSYETCTTISNALLTKVVPPISTLDTQYTWDPGCDGAKMMSAKDPNGFSVSATYNDPFWRPTSSTDQLNNTLNLSYYPTVPLNTQEAQMTFGSSDFDVFKTTDALGRPTLGQQIEFSGGSWDTVQGGYSWNSTGHVTTRTMPCATSKGGGCSNGTITITHDALGRPLVSVDGGGGTKTYSYLGSSSCTSPLLGCTIVTAILGPAPSGEVVKEVAQEFNGLGQLVGTCAISSATGSTACGFGGYTGFPTAYVYNSDGTIASVSKSSSTNTQTHSFTYDALGRTLTASYPESGVKQFFYDSAPSTPGAACSATALPTGTGLNVSPLGNLVKTYDANGTTTCFSYDVMNRNTGIAYSGTNWDGANKYFVYDSATVNGAAMANALGRVAEAYTAPTASGTKITDEGFSYTARGEVSDVYESTPNSGGYYHTSATYFANGAVNTLSGVPGQMAWVFSLDGKGRPYSAIQDPSTNLVSSVTYNAANQPCIVTLGLGDTDTYAYDSNPCTTPLVTGRMSSYTFSVGASPKTDAGSLGWNANGTLRSLSITDGFNSGGTQSCNYGTSSTPGYDELGRLVSAVCANSGTNVWGQNFGYDAFNNLTKTVPNGDTGSSWIPGYTQTNNQYIGGGTVCTGATICYDANGNLLKDSFHTYTWNQDNHPLTVTGGTSGPVVYDAFGRMVEHLNGTTYKQPLISPIGNIGLMTRALVSQMRIPLPGGDLYDEANFWHKDWLGSVRLASTRTGRAETIDRAFAPFGETYNAFGASNDVNFTGDNQDLVVGTFDTPNRELNPTQGRWISPDPSHSGWNAYSYTTNPLGETDPSGLNWQTVLLATYAYTSYLENLAGTFAQEFEFSNVTVTLVDQFAPTIGNGLMSPGPFPPTGGFVAHANSSVTVAPTYVATVDDHGNWTFTLAEAEEDIPTFAQENSSGNGDDTATAANNGPSWGATFFSTLGNGLLHGVRQPGQSFSECVNQNITTMTFGTVDPSKLFNQALGQLEGAATFLSIATVPGMGSSGVPIGPLMAGSFAQAMGQTGLSAAAFMRAAAGGMQTLAVAGAATVGAGIGSSINCR
jgi:RHS repeat-associated protein